MGNASQPLSARQPQPLRLDADAAYDCPICRHGQLQPMTLMDAYACNFCRHILDVNLAQQTVHVVDRIQPTGWRWQGWRWQPLHQESNDTTLALWVVGLGLTVFPAGIVALGAYMFPPLEDTAGVNWSVVWAVGTLVVHGAMVGWLLAEHYQFPPYVLAKIRLDRLLENLSE
ncbi:MAG: hypothetical protein ACFCVD_06365 [Nodosilinea sp.]